MLILLHLWVMCMLLVLAKACILQDHRGECYVSMQDRIGLPDRTKRCTATPGKMPMDLNCGNCCDIPRREMLASNCSGPVDDLYQAVLLPAAF